jgi:hypothetical protein
MSFKKILFALSPQEEKESWSFSIANAMKISRWMEAEICIVSNDTNEVAYLLGERESAAKSATLLSYKGDSNTFLEETLSYLCDTQTDLLLVVGWNYDQAKQLLLSEKTSLVEQCIVPCMVLPQNVTLDYPPFHEIVIPMSGEVKHSSALALGLKIAREKNLPVDIIHVTPESECVDEKFPDRTLKGMGDQLQHEYPNIIDQFLSEASPMSGPEEKQRIRQFYHCCGDVKKELLDMLNRQHSALILIEWGGTLEAERAPIIKELIKDGKKCFLLVSRAKKSFMRLKTG